MIDHLIRCSTQAEADTLQEQFGDWCSHHLRIILQDAVWDNSDPENPVLVTPEVTAPGFHVWVSLDAIDESLRDLPNNACRWIADTALSGPDASLESVFVYHAVDITPKALATAKPSPIPAGRNYPFGNFSLPSKPTTSAAPIIQEATTRTTIVDDHITARLEGHPQDLALTAAMLSAAVLQELESIRSSRPNDPSTLAYFDRYSSFLEYLASSLEALSAAISEAARTPQKDGYSTAVRIVETIRERIDCWCAENAEIVTGVKQTATIGLGIAFLSSCGAPPAFASAISAATFGGAKLARTIRDYYGKQGT